MCCCLQTVVLAVVIFAAGVILGVASTLTIQRKLEKRQSKIENNKERSHKYWFLWIIITTLIIVLLGVSICCHISSCVIKNENVVLTFVGILATFVVVSNYAQVKDIERKADEHKKELESRISVLEGKVSKTNDDMIDIKLNSSDNVKYMRFEVSLIIKEGGYQLNKIINELVPTFGNKKQVLERLTAFSKGKNESRDFIFALADAMILGKDDYPQEDSNEKSK